MEMRILNMTRNEIITKDEKAKQTEEKERQRKGKEKSA